MIIRSRTKDKMVNTNSIALFYIAESCDGAFSIFARFADGSTNIGGYETEQRAFEILDEIQRCYTQCALSGSSPVYEMPEE